MSGRALLARFDTLVQSRASATALVDGRGEWSREDLARHAGAVARKLRAAGLTGKRVALLAPPTREWAAGFWGILAAGATVVPLADIHPTSEQVRCIGRAAATGLVGGPGLQDRVSAVLSAIAPEARPRHIEVPVVGASAPAAGLDPFAPAADEPAVAFSTSGTTGVPKLALLGHEALAALVDLVSSDWAIDDRDCLAHALPLHHMHGLGIAYLVCALSGASVRLIGKFDAARVWDSFADSTVFMAVPTMHHKLLDAFDKAAESRQRVWRESARRLRLVTSGSAALPVSIAERWRQLVGEIPLERFGMTEVGVALSNPLRGPRVLGSCGRPLPGMQVRIVDERGADVNAGRSGELWFRGPSVFSGYDDVQATVGAFRDGWFKSGDTAEWLPDGFVRILGRTSVDIIKSGGYKLSALEIEEALRACAGVDDAAVVGLPDPTWGELVAAAVVGEAKLDEPSIREELAHQLANYKLPRRLVQLASLPRNTMGKVDKKTLQQILLGSAPVREG